MARLFQNRTMRSTATRDVGPSRSLSSLNSPCRFGIRILCQTPWYIAGAAVSQSNYFKACEVVHAPMSFIAASSSASVFVASEGLLRRSAVYLPLMLSSLPNAFWVGLADGWNRIGLNNAMIGLRQLFSGHRLLCLAAGVVSVVVLLCFWAIRAETTLFTMEHVGIVSTILNVAIAARQRVVESLLVVARDEMLGVLESLETPVHVAARHREYASQVQMLRFMHALEEMDEASEEESRRSSPTSGSSDMVDTFAGYDANHAAHITESDSNASHGKADAVETPPERVECVICMDKPACSRMTRCGHMIACNSCRRSLVFAKLVSLSPCSKTAATRRNLSRRTLDNAPLPCPLCRAEGCLRFVS